MPFPILVSVDDAIALHASLLVDLADADGGHDARLLDSAIQRPINLAAYGSPDIAALAAAYAFGIVRDRPFAQGNAQTATAVTALFLTRNDWTLAVPEDALRAAVDRHAAEELDETGLAAWIRENGQIAQTA
jgi:death-on-curing protein